MADSKIPTDKSYLIDQDITINYDLCLSGRIHIQSGKTMTISENKILYIHEKAILLNEGTLSIGSGSKVYVNNSGVLISNGTISNNGEISSPPTTGNGSAGEFGTDVGVSWGGVVLEGTFGGVVAMTITQNNIDDWNSSMSTIIDSDGDTYIKAESSTDNDQLKFYTSGGERMVVTSQGFVRLNSLSGTGNRMVVTNADGLLSAQAITSGGSGSGPFDSNDELTGHIIPTQNAQFDLGNAEYKIRHLFLSDNSLWVGDDHKISVSDGKMKFVKRKKESPKYVKDIPTTTKFTAEHANGVSEITADDDSNHTLAFRYINVKFSSEGVTHGSNTTLAPHHWEAYVQAFGGDYGNNTIIDIYPNGNFVNDFDEEVPTAMGGQPVETITDPTANKITFTVTPSQRSNEWGMGSNPPLNTSTWHTLLAQYNILRNEVVELKELLDGVLRFKPK